MGAGAAEGMLRVEGGVGGGEWVPKAEVGMTMDSESWGAGCANLTYDGKPQTLLAVLLLPHTLLWSFCVGMLLEHGLHRA